MASTPATDLARERSDHADGGPHRRGPSPNPARELRRWESEDDLELLDLQVIALCSREDPLAQRVSELAWHRCESGPAQPPLIRSRVAAHLGRVCVLLQDWRSAVRHLERAQTIAVTGWAPGQLGKIRSDLAVAYLALGLPRLAAAHAMSALRGLRAVGDELSVVRAGNNLGLAQLRCGQLDEAESVLGGALTACERLGVQAGRGHLLLTFAELHLARGNHRAARETAAEAARGCEILGERLTTASAYEWLGRIAARDNRARDADRYFGAALELLADLGAPHRRVTCLLRYAAILERRGDLGGALRHHRQAALIAAVRVPTTELWC